MAGPLAGLTIVEIAGIGPGPFCAMMLADHGARVIRVERPGTAADRRDPLLRSREPMTLDLKVPGDVVRLRALVKEANGFIEGFRPGVMERLGLGPDVLLGDNPQLVYGRMTGWGQEGPLAPRAGHDINYIAVSGALGMIGRQGGPPVPPINLVGDFGGGAMMLAFGMVSAMLAVQRGGPGQVVDCAMTDGSALLTAMMWGFRANGMWQEERGTNLLDTGAPFYDVYATSDGGHMAVGAIEPQFYAALLHGLELEGEELFAGQLDRGRWPAQRARLAEVFATKTRDEWDAVFADTDACCAGIMSMSEALAHSHNAARGTFVTVDGVEQPAPAPRYSATPLDMPR